MARARDDIGEQLFTFALTLPDAWKDQPWEEDTVAKVRKKIFAFIGTGGGASLGVKLPRSAPFALSLACATPMAYGLGKHGWVTVQLDAPDTPSLDVLKEWIEESYCALAPKTLARQLIVAGAPALTPAPTSASASGTSAPSRASRRRA